MVCFSPRHDLTLGRMAPEAIRKVVDLWADQTAELGARVPLGAGLREPRRGDGRLQSASARADLGRHGPAGRGRARGCGAAGIPGVQGPATAARLRRPGDRRLAGGRRDRRLAGRRPVLGGLAVRDAADPEAPRGPPGRARRVRSRRPGRRSCRTCSAATTGCSSDPSRTPWAGTRRRSTTSRPTRGRSTPTSIRRCSAGRMRKFMVGYELLAETQRDLTAEDAAARLRAVVPAAMPVLAPQLANPA